MPKVTSPQSLYQFHSLTADPEHGQGAENAPGHTEGKAPGERPVASDSGVNAVGIERGTNQPGEKGLKDELVSSEGNTGGQAQMKS